MQKNKLDQLQLGTHIKITVAKTEIKDLGNGSMQVSTKTTVVSFGPSDLKGSYEALERKIQGVVTKALK